MSMNRFSWATARTVSEAAAAASSTVADAMSGSSDAADRNVSLVKAGGIDLLDLMKEDLLAAGMLINLHEIPGLDAIAEEPDGSLRVGPMVTLAHLAEHPVVRRRYSALFDAVRSSASPQIRNVATLGGNLLQRPRCWYFRAVEHHCLRKGGDHCFALVGENQYHAIFGNGYCAIVHPSTAATALVALGATIELTNAQGAVRRVLLEEFFVPPERDIERENDLRAHEILTAILLPRMKTGVRMAHLKQGEKDSVDWSLADVAVVLDLDSTGRCEHAAIVLGAAAPVPYRAKGAEAALVGKRLERDVAEQAANAALKDATPLAKNAYKVPLFATLVRRAILKTIGQA
jgi:xanthine dehydrogenase YagS FAD-binding subunit